MERMASETASKTEFLAAFRNEFQEAGGGSLPAELDFSLEVSKAEGDGSGRKRGCCELTRNWTIVLSVAVAVLAALLMFGVHRFQTKKCRQKEQTGKRKKKKKRGRESGGCDGGGAEGGAVGGGEYTAGRGSAGTSHAPIEGGMVYDLTIASGAPDEQHVQAAAAYALPAHAELAVGTVTRIELIDFLQVHDPAKVGNADLVLRLYENRHVELRRALEQKYGAPITKKEEHSALSSVPISKGDLAGALDRVDLETEKPDANETRSPTIVATGEGLASAILVGDPMVPTVLGGPEVFRGGVPGGQQQQELSTQQYQQQQQRCISCGNTHALTQIDSDSQAYCQMCWDAYHGEGSFADCLAGDRSDTHSMEGSVSTVSSLGAQQPPSLRSLQQTHSDRSPSPDGYLV
jgi:hypothetical protein